MKDGSGRELHDTTQQHLRALKAMGSEPSGPFVTSVLEDVDTIFEWQKHSQSNPDMPHYQDLLNFIDLRAQASETSMSATSKKPDTTTKKSTDKVTSFTANSEFPSRCNLCKDEKHPLYVCTKFKSLSHDDKIANLRANNLCMNCLGSSHIARSCKSIHRCKECQKSHHTLLHKIPADDSSKETTTVVTNAVRLRTFGPMSRVHQDVRVSGIAGMSHKVPIQSIAKFEVSPVRNDRRKSEVTAIVVPRVTCDIPLRPVPFDLNWKHLNDLPLADPKFGQPGRVDILLGVDVFVNVLLHGRRVGPTGSPVAFETEFGWVLGGITKCTPTEHVGVHVVAYHTSFVSGEDILHKFWEVEESPRSNLILSCEERAVVKHFQANHTRNRGRFIVPLPKKPNAPLIGESRSQAVRVRCTPRIVTKSLTR